MVFMANVRAHIYVTGIVQGVWYRASAVEKGLELGDVAGWVKNLPDGRVELVCEGPKESMEKLIEWLWQGPELARVADVLVQWEKPVGDLRQFSVRRQ
ncbi:Acylphosphate phosphohydrolase, putative [hydrothermal vent metagenome]|uniref:Acylphosphate phosphohydrolase, putative n=1 Tax=hydrothermal vent metagenome TaxID=652676 RepID=A0A3B1C945_9ZZZZ